MSIKNLRNTRRKSVISVIALMALMLTVVLPAVNAIFIDTTPRKTTAYISVAPKVIGKGQQLTVNAWVWPAPSGPSYFAQDLTNIYFENFTATFTRPDGSKDTFMPENPSVTKAEGHPVPGKSEAVGTTYFYYKLNQVGTWSVSFSFPGKIFYMPNDKSIGVLYEAATSQTITFEVVEDPVNAGILNGWPWSPLPTGYWDAPVNTNNREWYEISGNWLPINVMPGGSYRGGFNPYSTGPETGHILWKEQVELGGLVGGDWHSFSYSGGRGRNVPIIIEGLLIYNDYAGNTFSCRDLRTGELRYKASGSVSHGWNQRQDLETPGVPRTETGDIYGFLWGYSGSSWIRYDVFTGAATQTITGAPTDVRDRVWMDGDNTVYISQAGGWNTTRLHGYAYSNLIKWDYSKVTGNSWKTGIVWNVSTIRPDVTSVGDGRRNLFQVIRFDAAGVVIAKAHNDEGHFQAYDMETGAFLYTKVHGVVDKNAGYISPTAFTVWDSAKRVLIAFDVKTGNKLWESDVIGEYGWGAAARDVVVAFDTIYQSAWDGFIYALDVNTGKLKWKSEWVGESTETALNAVQGASSIIATGDGKLFWSYVYPWDLQPRQRFQELIAMDAFTGKILWRVSGGMGGLAAAQGYLVAQNAYDGFEYGFGKGKTATTVTAPTVAIPKGTPVLIQGTIMDMSPAQPNTPAVAKESMTEWMNYLHMQNATLINHPPSPKGVPVQLYAVDPNGNIQDIGTVTSDSLGHYEIMWEPPVEGTYKVLASFAGDESYWSSSAEAALGVTEAPQANGAGEQVAVAADNTLLFAAVIVAVIVAIAIGLVNLLMIRKRQ